MNIKKQFCRNIAALLLTVALMLPTVIQFLHSFEGHEHFACTEQTTHFHKTVDKCEICSFHLASFNYDVAPYPDFVLSNIPSKIEKQLSSLLFHSFTQTNTQLRAPPYFLVS